MVRPGEIADSDCDQVKPQNLCRSYTESRKGYICIGFLCKCIYKEIAQMKVIVYKYIYINQALRGVVDIYALMHL